MRKKIHKKYQLSFGVLAVAAFGASNAYAQVDEIVVTSQKREKTLLDTPVAVTAISGQQLEESQLRTLRDIQAITPSLQIWQAARPANTSHIIRGLGTASNNRGLEPSVGVFIDGVYRARTAASLNDFLSIQRVEVVRGPQSTLYGKNTPAGVISIITKKPEFEFGGDAEVTFGNYNNIIMKGSFTGPITDTVALRLSVNRNKRDGFFTNVFDGSDVNGRDRTAFRGQLLFEPNDAFSLRVIGDYGKLDENCCAAPFYFNLPANVARIAALGGTVLPAEPYDRNVNFDGEILTELRQYGVSGHVDWDLGGAKLSSISAYRGFDNSENLDVDFTDIELSQQNLNFGGYKTFTQELRLESTGDNVLDWMVGYYYFNNELDIGRSAPNGASFRPLIDLSVGSAIDTLEFFQGIPNGTYFAAGDGVRAELYLQETVSHAAFAQVDLNLTDDLTVTGGVRWTTEDKDLATEFDIVDPFSDLDLTTAVGGLFAGLAVLQSEYPDPGMSSISDDNVTGNAIISYDATDNIHLYASYSRGYKAAGFNLALSAGDTGSSFDAETANSYELGAKMRLLENKAMVNLAIFDTTLKNFQQSAWNGEQFVLVNAGEAQTRGVELEALVRPVNPLLWTLGVTYLDAKYNSFEAGPCQVFDPSTFCDLSGNRIASTAKWTLSSTASYRANLGVLDATLRGEVYYVGDRNLGVDNDPAKFQEATTQLAASVTFTQPGNDRWQLQIWGKNLTDAEFAQNIFNSILQQGSYSGYPGDPRTWGATIRVKI